MLARASLNANKESVWAKIINRNSKITMNKVIGQVGGRGWGAVPQKLKQVKSVFLNFYSLLPSSLKIIASAFHLPENEWSFSPAPQKTWEDSLITWQRTARHLPTTNSKPILHFCACVIFVFDFVDIWKGRC